MAAKLNVARQSVSKWESMTSIPDLDKIVKLSQIFGVSTDYLLKDEIEEDVVCVEEKDFGEAVAADRAIDLNEANSFVALEEEASLWVAAGVSMCVLSPVPLILLGGFQEYGNLGITENSAGGIGVIILLLMVACAVAIFIYFGMKLEKYSYLEKENLSLEYGVAAFGGTDLTRVCSVGVLLAMIAGGVFLFVKFGTVKSAYDKLLEEGDYTREKKEFERKNGAAVAAVLFGAFSAILSARQKKK